jgi:hypothetical protein
MERDGAVSGCGRPAVGEGPIIDRGELDAVALQRTNAQVSFVRVAQSHFAHIVQVVRRILSDRPPLNTCSLEAVL